MKPQILTRRSFLSHTFRAGLAAAFGSLIDIPWVMKRALAEGTIGVNGTKLLFIFLRGANDGLNSVIPILDPAYNTTNRPNILIPADPATDYSTLGGCDFPAAPAATAPTFGYAHGIRLGNGFAALHPSLKFLAPVYNAGHLALIHRVGYPKQSRSHFDSQKYWESGAPNHKLINNGIFYRTLWESGLTQRAPLTGISLQSALPLSLRGSAAAMANLTDPTRYDLLGLPNTAAGQAKADQALRALEGVPFADKKNRDLLDLQYRNFTDTLSIFASLDFTESGNVFRDDANTDNDTAPYYLFPTSNAKNGGYALHGNDPAKYVVDTNAYGFFNNLKAAALVLNKTDAIIAGTEFGGFDTHNNQGGATGAHANLQRRIAWAMYGLRKYFLNHADKATWDKMVIVTLSEFGRTTVQNGSLGTDHAEASVMFVAGGGVKGYISAASRSGVFGCSPTPFSGQNIAWIPGQTGSMFGVGNRYLQRATDYRSVLGEIIRGHLGATTAQLQRILPGYATTNEYLQTGGTSGVDGTKITGELGIV